MAVHQDAGPRQFPRGVGLAPLVRAFRSRAAVLTRARQRIDISHAANRRIHNLWQSAIPSRFVEELPKDQIEVTSEVSGHGGFGQYGVVNQSTGDEWVSSTTGGPGWQRFQKHLNEPKTIEGMALPVNKVESLNRKRRQKGF